MVHKVSIFAFERLLWLWNNKTAILDTTIFAYIVVAFSPAASEVRLVIYNIDFLSAEITVDIRAIGQVKLVSSIASVDILPYHAHSVPLIALESLSLVNSFQGQLEINIFLIIACLS